VLTGKASAAPQEFNLSGPAAMDAWDALAEIDEPRPSPTRYPISRELFSQLKEESLTAQSPEKTDSTIIKDEAQAPFEIASAAPGMDNAASAFVPFAAPTATYPTASTNFAGIAATSMTPPDCTLAVGPDHVLVSVNSTLAIYQKTGNVVHGPRTLTAWFSNVTQGAMVFDPKALYDQHSNRWVLVAVARNTATKGSWFLVSVSQSSDPLQGWHNYALDATLDGGTKTENWADYPCVGVDSHALYLTANMFRFGGGFQYAKLRIVPKADIYEGKAAAFKDLVRLRDADGSLSFTVHPCHTYGAPQAQYFVNSYFPRTKSPETKLSLWTLTDPLGTPALALSTITTDPYNLPPDAVQQGGAVPIESGDVRILNAVFRGGSIWCALNTQHNWGDNVNVAAVHWFQIEAASGALIQQGIYGARGSNYLYPAVMPDNNGNMVMVFSRCSSTEFASIYFTGRKAADPLGELQPSSLLLAGAAFYQKLDMNGKNRWGDYAGIASDPANSGLIWFYSMAAAAGNLWTTWVGSAF
jgi:hypothetical protein